MEISYPQEDNKIMFLSSVHNRTLKQLGQHNLNIFCNLIGNLEKQILEFCELGLLKQSDYYECIDNSMTVSKLKEFIKSKNIKPKGKKINLIEQASSLFSDNEKLEIIQEGNKLTLTEKGKDLVYDDYRRYETELKYFQDHIIDLFYQGENDKACKLVADFYSADPFPIGMGNDYSEGFHPHEINVVKHLISSNYLTQSMELDELVNKKLRAILATYCLFNNYPIKTKDHFFARIFEMLPNFECKEITDFMSRGPTGIFWGYSKDDRTDIIEIFIHTILCEADNSVRLNDVKTMDRRYWKGIEILAGDSRCNICNGKSSRYKWDEIEKIPKLPKYPGCICMYSYFSDDE